MGSCSSVAARNGSGPVRVQPQPEPDKEKREPEPKDGVGQASSPAAGEAETTAGPQTAGEGAVEHIAAGEDAAPAIQRPMMLELPTSLAQRAPTIGKLLRQLHHKEKTCVEMVESLLARINEADVHLNACIDVLRDSALAQAKAVDVRIADSQPLRPLEGLPILVKANVDVAGSLTTAATEAFAKWRPETNADCTQKLIEAGAIVLAKTNLPELALRADGWNSLHGLCRNPVCLNRNCGGSSSGSGAGVAAGYVPASIGSDTAGSVRIPAACCGLVGFRPSRGRWPEGGIVPLDAHKDTAGPIAQTVADCALIDGIVMGLESPEELKPTPLSGLKIHVPTDWISRLPEPTPLPVSARKALDAVTAKLEAAGALIDREPGFAEKVLDIVPPFSLFTDYKADMEIYLQRHASSGDCPENLPESVAKVAEAIRGIVPGHTKRWGTAESEADLAPEKVAERLAERTDKTNACQAAYRAFLEERGLTAVLAPTLGCEPVDVSAWSAGKDLGDAEPPPSHMRLTAFFCMRLTEIPVPSVALPVPGVECGEVPSLPASVMVLGQCSEDRALLQLAEAIEVALKEVV